LDNLLCPVKIPAGKGHQGTDPDLPDQVQGRDEHLKRHGKERQRKERDDKPGVDVTGDHLGQHRECNAWDRDHGSGLVQDPPLTAVHHGCRKRGKNHHGKTGSHGNAWIESEDEGEGGDIQKPAPKPDDRSYNTDAARDQKRCKRNYHLLALPVFWGGEESPVITALFLEEMPRQSDNLRCGYIRAGERLQVPGKRVPRYFLYAIIEFLLKVYIRPEEKQS
jgi:hypothetical protein